MYVWNREISGEGEEEEGEEGEGRGDGREEEEEEEEESFPVNRVYTSRLDARKSWKRREGEGRNAAMERDWVKESLREWAKSWETREEEKKGKKEMP